MFGYLSAFRRNEEGSSIVLLALALAGILAILGLVIDGGTLYATKTHLQKAANAAVLSGAQELTNQSAKVTQVVGEVLTKHGETSSLYATNIEMGHKVTIQLQRNVPLAFSSLFGLSSTPVSVKAAAELQAMGRAQGAAPLGIDDSIQLVHNVEYTLKVDQTEATYGNFGILALGGPGASTYEDNLMHGYTNELKIGDVIDTQTGNIVGKTRNAVNFRIDACPYVSGDMSRRDCPRIILVPTYRPNITGNQLKSITVTGFAFFYITDPMSSKDKTVKGMFISRADTGFSDPNATAQGAFAIKLTE